MGKSARRSVHVRCPACGRGVRIAEQVCLDREKVLLPWFATHDDLLAAVAEGKTADPHSDRKFIHWACNECLRNGRAIKATQEQQKYFDCWPYYAYLDETRTCPDCGKEFVFSKEEQEHWYETLKFWVQSRPKYCKACKKAKET